MSQPGGNNYARYAEYDHVGRMTSLQSLETAAGSTYATQTWTYNGLGQMTRQTITGQVDIEYRFSTTQNDGRITHRKDWISGEEVAYLYDTLGRMTSAATTGPEWGQSFVFDGFGNLTQQVVTKGSAPAMSMTVNAANNRLTGTGISYDSAGNLLSDSLRSYSYDVFGRLGGTAGETYVYGPRNERVLINKADGTRELNIYGVDGLLYAVWRWNGTAWSRVTSKERIYFAGRLIMIGGEKVVTDRLGSVVRKGTQNVAYYPYGQERTSTANDTAKFGTYTRDSATGLDYAMNRYYQSSWGRFTTADPYRASGGPENPASWNRYSYVLGDPINSNDPSGLLYSSCSAEFSYEQCGGDALFWGGGGGGAGGSGFGGGHAAAVQQGYSPGMPSAMWSALQQYNQAVQSAYDASQANAAIAAGDYAAALSIVAGNSALQFVWIPNIGTLSGQTYQQVVDAYLKGLGIWDLINHTTLRWHVKGDGGGYTFQFMVPKQAAEALANNPLFANGILGAFHVADAGFGAGDYRSWTGSGLPFSLQITAGDGGAWADVDRYNPYTGLGFIQHTIWEVLPWWKGQIP